MKKILIVEDEKDLAQNIGDILVHLGHEVMAIFDNGKDVMTYLKSHKPDLILMDIQIKGDMDGIELCRQVKHSYNVPVVYLTAFSSTPVLDRIADFQYEGYLLKPFTVEELRSAVYLGINAPKIPLKKQEKNILTIKDKGFTIPIPYNEILFLKADGLYTKIQTKSKVYIVRDILKDISANLPESEFIRVHKSYIVRFKEINSFNAKELHVQEHIIPIRRGLYKDIKKLVGDA